MCQSESVLSKCHLLINVMALINANLILRSDIPHYIYNISVQYQLESLFAVCMPQKVHVQGVSLSYKYQAIFWPCRCFVVSVLLLMVGHWLYNWVKTFISWTNHSHHCCHLSGYCSLFVLFPMFLHFRDGFYRYVGIRWYPLFLRIWLLVMTFLSGVIIYLLFNFIYFNWC